MFELGSYLVYNIFMKVLILYYSGTGNTKIIANMLKDCFTNKDCQVEVFDFLSKSNYQIENYDYIGLGYPIYAFNAPKIFEKSIKKVNISRKKVFIFKTSGEPLKLNNASSNFTIKYLKKNNNVVLGDYHLMMPYNIHFRFEDNVVKQMYLYNLRYCRYIVNNVLNEHKEFIEYGLLLRFITFIFKIQRFGAFVNSKLYKVNNNKCISCYKCINECPTHNIYLKKDKICFKSKCEMCMRCCFNCPQDAISIGFLNNWKVNKPYDFIGIINDESLDGKAILTNQKGFFKAHVKYYQKIEKKLIEFEKNE